MDNPKPLDTNLAQKIVDLLRQIAGSTEQDRAALEQLINTRIPVSEYLAHHPTIQIDVNDAGEYTLGLLGILNGLCGVDQGGAGYVQAIMDDGTGCLIGFQVSGTD